MHVSRSLKALQTQSMAYRRAPKARYEPAGYQPALCETNWQPKLCQWIDGTPSRQQIRRHGSQAFMCQKAVRPESSYCEAHHSICYVKALTTDEEQAGSDE
jgi:hypothetical protein